MAVKKVSAMVYAQLSDDAKKLYKMDDKVSGKDSVKAVRESVLYKEGIKKSKKKKRSSSSSSSSVASVQTVANTNLADVDVADTTVKFFEEVGNIGWDDVSAEKVDSYIAGKEKPPQSLLIGGGLVLLAVLFG